MRESDDIGSAWLPLISTTKLFRIKRPQVLRADHHAIGNAQAFQLVRDFDVVHHASADECQPCGLQSRRRQSPAGCDGSTKRSMKAALCAAPRGKFLRGGGNGAIGRRIAGALGIRAVTEEREHAFLSVSSKRVQVELVLSGGVWSILKSPVWMITPTGVRTASATQSIVLCVTE